MKTALFYLLALPLACCLFTACGSDDDEDSANVVISDDGKASNGMKYVAIDDNNFYLDNVMYTVESGHIAVSGFEKNSFKGEADIPASITYKGSHYDVAAIAPSAFTYCQALIAVDIPTSVTTIGSYAFYYCSSLANLNIPSTITTIGDNAFAGCSGLTSIKVDKDNAHYDSRDGCNAIIDTKTNTLIAGCRNTIIPATVTAIGKRAFAHCASLKTLTVPGSVTTIGNSAYYECSGLTTAVIGNAVTTIGDGAFYACTSLTAISLGTNVTTIGNGVFDRCDRLEEIHCKSLTPPTILNNTFPYLSATLYVPKGTKQAYQSADVWRNFTNIVEE
ncbi:MAG: leucine-rich repeat protein [Prevotella sp.]|nr:leucine-rich repeat protein [Prevotella sp.]